MIIAEYIAATAHDHAPLAAGRLQVNHILGLRSEEGWIMIHEVGVVGVEAIIHCLVD